jgi:hypothetical protein
MSGSPDGPWVLQVPFKTKPDLPLQEAHTTTLNGLPAEFRPGAFGHINLIVTGISTDVDARELYESLRLALLVGALNVRFGVTVRPDILVLTQESPMPNEPDLPLIYPVGKDLSRLVVGAISFGKQPTRGHPTPYRWD